MADRDVARESREHRFTKDIGYESHAAMRAGHSGPIDSHHARRLLAAVLQAVEPQICDTGRVGHVRYADDPAHRFGQSPMRRGMALKYTSLRRPTDSSTLPSRSTIRTVPSTGPTVPTRSAGTPNSPASACTAAA